MKFLQVLNPFAPHIAHELSERAGFARAEWEQWPTVDESKLVVTSATVAVQINGKIRATILLAPDAKEADALAAARAQPAVEKWLQGKAERQVVYVPGKVLNIVIDGQNKV